MSKGGLKAVIKTYKDYFEHTNYEPKQFPKDRYTLFYRASHKDLFNHCYFMVLEMWKFVDEDEQKAHRWLGFIQGCFWALGEATIGSLVDLNVYIEKEN